MKTMWKSGKNQKKKGNHENINLNAKSGVNHEEFGNPKNQN